MKVLHAIFSFQTGGSETMLIDIINQQCRKASVSLIIVNNKVNVNLLETIDKRVNIFLLHRKESAKLQLFRIYIRINKILNTIAPDVIHCHDNKLYPFFINRKKKTCLTVHNVNLSVLFLNRYRKLFAISTAVQEDIKKRAGADAKIIYNGIEIDQYQPRNDYRFDTTKEEFKIVQVSRLFPEQKGQHIAVRSFEIFKKQYPGKNIKLYFVGGGDALAELQKLAIQYNVQNNIVFLGQVDRIWVKNNLQNYHLLIQPSLFEGFGLTVIEGLACGLPVIASDLDGPEEISGLLGAGLLARPNDPVDLAEKIRLVYESYLSGNILNTNCLLVNKKELDLFDIRTTADNYLKEYSSVSP
jgi:glycosyltransferase involved in cell wall biosynthesis